MKYLIPVFATIFLSLELQAQCDDCQFDNEMDYCFQSNKYSDFCAGFLEDQTTFVLRNGKKTRDIPFDVADIDSTLIAIASERKLKIKPLEILFIQEALQKWSVERLKLGYEFTKSGLGIKILKQGEGPLLEKGQNVTVHYTGRLLDGTKFDSSVDRGRPFTFPLGRGRVIKGWDEGVAMLNVGTKALLYIPPKLGYGKRGAGRDIPPGATLIFEVEVLE